MKFHHQMTAAELEDEVRRFCMDDRRVNERGEDALAELVLRADNGDRLKRLVRQQFALWETLSTWRPDS